MSNYVSYLLHKSFNPVYYHRDYKNDITENEKDSALVADVKRAINIALPFLSLYKPLGNVISKTMGTVRIASHIQGVNIAEDNMSKISEVGQTALAVAAFAGTVFQYKLGTYLTTGSDIVINLGQMAEKLSKKEYKDAAEATFRALNNAFYLSIMMTGSLEVVLISLLIQAALSFYQSKKEWQDGKQPEAVAQMFMGMIRLYQGRGQMQQIKRRDYLFSLRKLDLLRDRIEKGRSVDHILDHPLAGLSKRVHEQQTILKDVDGNEYKFGANFHGLGKGAVKGMNVCFKERKYAGQNITELSFKVNHVFRDHLQNVIDETKGYSEKDLSDLLQIMGSNATNICFEETTLSYADEGGKGKAWKISLEDFGTIFIGSNPELPTMYDRITIHMKKGANLYQFHELLSLFELDQVLQVSLLEDIERMKIGQLFRVFCPKEATLFERTEEFFTLPIEDLKLAIIQKRSEMEEHFLKYLPKMELQEILPGRMRFAIRGLADELQEKGALGLTAAITGAYSDEEIFKRTANIFLEMGMMASEVRRGNGMQAVGLSQNADLFAGSSDSVFTQLVTKSLADEEKNWDEFWYGSKVRMCISLKVLESMTYQYHWDSFGVRSDNFWWGSGNYYLNRPNIINFVEEENRFFEGSNEVMIKERIDPSFITGLVVADVETRDALMEYFRKRQLVEMNEDGVETILGIQWDRFVRIGQTITKDLFGS